MDPVQLTINSLYNTQICIICGVFNFHELLALEKCQFSNCLDWLIFFFFVKFPSQRFQGSPNFTEKIYSGINARTICARTLSTICRVVNRDRLLLMKWVRFFRSILERSISPETVYTSIKPYKIIHMLLETLFSVQGWTCFFDQFSATHARNFKRP